jgi:hypothetical protein
MIKRNEFLKANLVKLDGSGIYSLYIKEKKQSKYFFSH